MQAAFRVLPAVTILGALSAWAAAGEEVVAFGTAKGRVSDVTVAQGASCKVTFTEEQMKVVGPNFWSNRWQFNNLSIDLTDAKGSDYLAIEASGETADEGPILKVLLISPDWSKKSIYHFDVSKLKKDEVVVLKATTPIGEPAEKEGGGVSTAAPIGNLMFITNAKVGANPWLLKIKCMSYGPGEAKKDEKKKD